jgi:hypothetical protein
LTERQQPYRAFVPLPRELHKKILALQEEAKLKTGKKPSKGQVIVTILERFFET